MTAECQSRDSTISIQMRATLPRVYARHVNTINSGSFEQVFSGANVSGATISGPTAAGTITFVSGGTLRIDGTLVAQNNQTILTQPHHG
jgi:autotransporter passenger strand-loop-strand repeat protein